MRLRTKLLLWGVGLFGALVVLLLAIGRVEEGDFRKRMAALRAQGYPVTAAELDAWYVEPPEGEDAADTYEKAFEKLWAGAARPTAPTPYLLRSDAKLPDPGVAWPPEVLGGVEAFLSEQQDILQLLHEGAKRDKARYSVDFNEGTVTKVPGGRLEAPRLLELETLARAERGDVAGAVDSLIATMRLAESLAEEPLLVSQMLRISAHGKAVDAFVRVLNRRALDKAQLERLKGEFSAAEKRDTFYRGYAGEQAILLDGLTKAGISMNNDFGNLGPIARVTGDLDWYMDHMPKLIEASRGSLKERREFAQAAAQEPRPPRYYVISSSFYAGIGQFLHKNLNDIANLRAAQTVAAVEQYVLERGTLPEKIEELAPTYLDAVPLDPYSDKPLLYRQINPGYIVYSIGADYEDDGGVDVSQKQPGQKWRDLDFALTVRR